MSHPEIARLETELAQAMLHNDLATLDRLLADDLMFSGPDGIVIDKARDLALHRSGDTVFTKYEIEELSIQIYQPIAIANVKVSLAGSFKGTTFAGDYR